MVDGDTADLGRRHYHRIGAGRAHPLFGVLAGEVERGVVGR